LGLLFTLKYFNFFVLSFAGAYDGLMSLGGGEPLSDSSLRFLQNFVLPVGISFYTFQTMSYTIDVYRGQLKAEKNFLHFALFVNFFPQLVAGPIERAGDLLPQLKKLKLPAREDIPLALYEILLGYFMKVYVADNIGNYIDDIYLASKAQYIQNPEFGFVEILWTEAKSLFQPTEFCFSFFAILVGIPLLHWELLGFLVLN
jgi:alginate O-acetyltransferase complex protein AlgI